MRRITVQMASTAASPRTAAVWDSARFGSVRRSPVAQLCNNLDAVSPRPLSGRRIVRFPLVSDFAVERENRPVCRQFAIEALGDPIVAVRHHVLLREPAQSRLAGLDMPQRRQLPWSTAPPASGSRQGEHSGFPAQRPDSAARDPAASAPDAAGQRSQCRRRRNRREACRGPGRRSRSGAPNPAAHAPRTSRRPVGCRARTGPIRSPHKWLLEQANPSSSA
jgi:hypothetical protein